MRFLIQNFVIDMRNRAAFLLMSSTDARTQLDACKDDRFHEKKKWHVKTPRTFGIKFYTESTERF